MQKQHTAVTEDISRYMEDIKQYKLISREREIELSFKIHNGTPEERDAAREELICANLKLTVKIAHDFKKYGVSFADLVGEGNIGLMTAADRFEAGHGAKFSCFASWWIRQSMRKAILCQSRTIRIPNCAAQMAAKLSKLKQEYLNEQGRMPSLKESSEALGISEERVESLSRTELTVCSINEKVNQDDDTTYEEIVAGETTEEQDKAEEKDHALAAVKKLLKTAFSDMDRYIIDKTFGLWGKILPASAISQETGIPEDELASRIKRICGQLKPMLKDMAFAL